MHIIVFDDWKSIIHLVVGFIAKTLNAEPPATAIFLLYQALECAFKIAKGKKTQILLRDFLGDIAEYSFGLLLGSLFP